MILSERKPEAKLFDLWGQVVLQWAYRPYYQARPNAYAA
jgi:hypothetical protein